MSEQKDIPALTVNWSKTEDDKLSPLCGMTLRDYFAAKVMQGFVANPSIFQQNSNSGWGLANCEDKQLIGYAFHIADSMLEARK